MTVTFDKDFQFSNGYNCGNNKVGLTPDGWYDKYDRDVYGRPFDKYELENARFDGGDIWEISIVWYDTKWWYVRESDRPEKATEFKLSFTINYDHVDRGRITQKSITFKRIMDDIHEQFSVPLTRGEHLMIYMKEPDPNNIVTRYDAWHPHEAPFVDSMRNDNRCKSCWKINVVR